jgi:outer membrane protein assembly complex protein YaeT
VNFSPAASRTPRRPGRRLAAAIVLAAAALAVPSASRADTDELLGALKRVEKVRFEGNHSVSNGAIKKVIRTGSGSFLGLSSPPLYRPDFLRADAVTIRNLYVRKGFLDAEVTASADSGSKPSRVVVTYHVVEGPRVLVRAMRVDSTVTVYTEKKILSWVKTKPGEPFDPVQLALDREQIGGKYAERGHFPTITTETERDSLAMDVRFHVAEGIPYHVRNVRIEGVDRVDTSAVVREVLLQPGDPFERDEMVESTERLYATGLFTAVDVTPTAFDSTSGRLDLNVRVRERKRRWVEGGVGTGTQELVRVGGEWGHRNLSGDGKRLNSGLVFALQRVDTSTVWSARTQVAFTEPWFLKTRTAGTIAVSAERQFEIYANRTYKEEAVGFTMALARDFFGAKSRISASMDNFWARSEVFRQSEGDSTEPSFLAPYVRRFTLAFDQDRRDDPLYPREGFLGNVTLQVSSASRGNSGRFLKSEGMYGRHFPYQQRASFGMRGRIARIGPWGDWGASEDETLERVPASDRYRIGGGSTVRGYHDNGIDGGGEGGLLLMVTNFELVTPIQGAFGLTWFVDGGNVWRHWSDFKPSQFFHTSGVSGTEALNDYRWSFGVGLRYQSPVGPIRLDVGRRLHDDENDLLAGRAQERYAWHFSFGPLF